jgi:hypothetical protein
MIPANNHNGAYFPRCPMTAFLDASTTVWSVDLNDLTIDCGSASFGSNRYSLAQLK